MLNFFLIVLEQSCLHMPLILGSYISISLMKVPDLSLESSYVFGAIIAYKIFPLLTHVPHFIGLIILIFASLLGGAFVGLISSSITQYARIPHLLSSILTFGIFHGFIQLISQPYASLGPHINPLTLFPLSNHHPELVMIVCIALFFILCCFFFFRTSLGYCYAVYGNNPFFFEHYNISTKYIFMSGILLGNALVGCSGYLFAQSNGFLEISMGVGKVLLCITSLILGKSIISTREPFHVLAPIGGIFSYFLLQQFILKLGLNLKYFTAIQALMVLALLIIKYRKKSMHTHIIDHLGV